MIAEGGSSVPSCVPASGDMQRVVRNALGLMLSALAVSAAHAGGPELRIVADCDTTVAAPGTPAAVPIALEAKTNDATGERNEVSSLDFTIDFDEARFAVGEQDLTLPATVAAKWRFAEVVIDASTGSVRAQIVPKFVLPLPVFDDGPVAQLRISARPSAASGCAPLNFVTGSAVFSSPPLGLPIAPGPLGDGQIALEAPLETGEACEDCIDNDGDGFVDREDDDCRPPANGGGIGLQDPQGRGKAAVKCQKAISKAGSAFAAKRLQRMHKCLDAAVTCVQKKPDDPRCLEKAVGPCDGALAARSEDDAQFADSIAKACGPNKPGAAPQVSLDDLTGALGLGYESESPGCTLFDVGQLASLADVVECIERHQECRIENVVGSEVPRAAELLALLHRAPAVEFRCLKAASDGAGRGLDDPKGRGKLALSCGETLEKASAKFIAGKTKLLRQCAEAVYGCVQLKPTDIGCVPKARGKCAAAIAKITDPERGLEAKLKGTVEKKCAGLPPADLFTDTGLGFGTLTGRCAALGVAKLESASDVAECLTLEHECRAEQLSERALPRLRELSGLGAVTLP